VRIRIEAFGLNRSELKLRLGLGVGVSFPRVPGIEAAGTVDAAPAGAGLARGQKVVAMMGDMGRTYDGGYAEYTSVPLAQVIPIDTGLPWEVLGACRRWCRLPTVRSPPGWTSSPVSPC
jgi:NADPH:quinone reductase-like Zn-dependent oxidoreductase